MENLQIKISGCVDCPMCQMNDICIRFSCKVGKQLGIDYNIYSAIRQDKYHMPITPTWCPLNEKTLLIIKDKS